MRRKGSLADSANNVTYGRNYCVLQGLHISCSRTKHFVDYQAGIKLGT